MMAIASDGMDRIYDAAVDSFLPSYMGLVFEEICKQYLIYYAPQLLFPLQDIGEWWGAHPKKKKEVQVDIVALGAKSDNAASGRRFIIGSCKYKNEPIGTDELDLLQDYASLFTTEEDERFYYIFSKSAFTSGLQEKQKQGEVTLVTLEEIYKNR